MGKEELEQKVTKNIFLHCDSYKACLYRKGTEKVAVISNGMMKKHVRNVKFFKKYNENVRKTNNFNFF